MEQFFTRTAGPGRAFAFLFAAALVLALAACPNLAGDDPVEHTITFDSQGGSAVNSVTAKEGTAVPEPEPPTKAGHTFQGWFSEASGGTLYVWPYTLQASITVYARWQESAPPQQYTITYELNGGANAEGNPSSYTAESGAIALAAPIRAGYTGAWHDNQGLTGNPVATIPAGSAGNKTFYAKWTVISYAITYALNE
jgi:uncharacterized repeat protein (TIGR02543 family)